MVPSILFKLAAATALLASYTEAASYNGLAITPQMGWVRTPTPTKIFAHDLLG